MRISDLSGAAFSRLDKNAYVNDDDDDDHYKENNTTTTRLKCR